MDMDIGELSQKSCIQFHAFFGIAILYEMQTVPYTGYNV